MSNFMINTDLVSYPNAGYHNSIYRGKNITPYYTDGSLYTRISSGEFTDLYVGDYFTANNITWLIAGFDTYLNKGDTALVKHHAAIIPATQLTTASMNASNTTAGGYYGSAMVTTTLNTVLNNYITPAFGNHVITYRGLLTNSINATGYNRWGTNSGCSNGWAWYDRKLDLMSEAEVFGTISWASSGYDIGTSYTQLPIFALAPEKITTRSTWWLSTIATATSFALVSNNGYSYVSGASISIGVRPRFFID